jgi:hypothetical protein
MRAEEDAAVVGTSLEVVPATATDCHGSLSLFPGNGIMGNFDSRGRDHRQLTENETLQAGGGTTFVSTLAAEIAERSIVNVSQRRRPPLDL